MKRVSLHLLISLSLANLSFLPVWNELLSINSRPYYLGDGDYSRVSLAALLAASLLALVYWIGMMVGERLQRSSLRAWAERIFLISLLLPLNGLRTMVPQLSVPHMFHYFTRGVLVALAILVSAFIWLVFVKWHRMTSRAVSVAALIMSPFIIITSGRVLWNIAQFRNIPNQERSSEHLLHQSESPIRLLWFVFDETDQRLTFDERPVGVKIPNLDRLKKQSLYCTNVIAAGKETAEAMPSLITGKMVEEVEPRGPDELMLRFAAQQKYVPWSSERTVFSTARELGLCTAIIGWYHPYCRVLGQSLDDCFWVPFSFAGENTLLPLLTYDYQSIIPIVSSQLRYREHVSRYLKIKREAERVAVDPGLNVILVHWPIPHMPFIYNRNNGKYEWVPFQDGYFGNLELVDECIGDIRKKMEDRGLWDQTIVLMTSDHSWRNSMLYDSKVDARVPYLLKLPGMKRGLEYNKRFNAVVTRDLFEGFMRGDFKTVEQVTRWLDAKSGLQ
jgi:hypothetical protein